MGIAAALSERRDDPDLTLSPTRLARKYHAEPATIRMTLRRLVEAGYLVKLGRNTYRLTHSARTLIAAERPQLFIPSMLRIDGMTPRLAAVHYVSVNAKIQSVAAKWFGVSERSWRSLRRMVDQLMKDNTSPIQPVPSVSQQKRNRSSGGKLLQSFRQTATGHPGNRYKASPSYRMLDAVEEKARSKRPVDVTSASHQDQADEKRLQDIMKPRTPGHSPLCACEFCTITR